MINRLRLWLRRAATRFFPRRHKHFKPFVYDDRIAECVHWVQQRPDGKHYIVCALLSTVHHMLELCPDATVTTIQRATTGWATSLPDAYLCCTQTLQSGPTATQLSGRIRGAHSKERTLIFLRHGRFK